ncbi:hypothetical protein GCM10023084_08700 [Streptomyces lacrimifluminis]|uniref:Integral membrane protein n=1 Tax=Streptomyces lacrimifluminis TaxID=1500077 RepID=A0A917KQD8_9ACTN|nr:hypothetical protein [Streptomyces lacrimifluminis]GGJ24444.1 hypothetical protein GCM10012282_21170 [Streptomyces lacrimifluminis]
MSELGELDRPGTPNSSGAWDEHSEEWLTGAAESNVRDTESNERGTETNERDTETTHTRSQTAPPSARAARRGTGDPVKALMHRHRELCVRAVDPLEIAAGLEAHGVTDRTAARFRHRDVFSLAEEMYARVSRDAETAQRPTPPSGPRVRADWALLSLLPGALCAATVTGLHLTEGRVRLAVATLGALAVALAVRAALGRGPLGPRSHPAPPGTYPSHTPGSTRAWTYWLLAYALLGDDLLTAALTGGSDGFPAAVRDLSTAPVLALTLACAPAAWCAHLFAAGARRKLGASRGLADFTAAVKPLLLGAFALFLCASAALVAISAAVLHEPAAYTTTVTLGALLLLARLLTAHGFTHAPAVVLGVAAATEAAALATAFASHLPGCAFLATPVETVVAAWSPAGIPAAACGVAVLVLLLHATRTLTRASAHALPDEAG